MCSFAECWSVNPSISSSMRNGGDFFFLAATRAAWPHGQEGLARVRVRVRARVRVTVTVTVTVTVRLSLSLSLTLTGRRARRAARGGSTTSCTG